MWDLGTWFRDGLDHAALMVDSVILDISSKLNNSMIFFWEWGWYSNDVKEIRATTEGGLFRF